MHILAGSVSGLLRAGHRPKWAAAFTRIGHHVRVSRRRMPDTWDRDLPGLCETHRDGRHQLAGSVAAPAHLEDTG